MLLSVQEKIVHTALACPCTNHKFGLVRHFLSSCHKPWTSSHSTTSASTLIIHVIGATEAFMGFYFLIGQ